MQRVISALEQVTPEWLTSVLQQKPLLARGQVLEIAVRPSSAFNSATDHLTVTFSEDAPATVPRHFLLKRNLQVAWARPAGIREAQFYQMVAQLPKHPAVIVPCFDAAWNPDTGDSHILLQDLSGSHMLPITRDQHFDSSTNIPSREHMQQVIDILARFHAFWWQNPHLGTGVAQIGEWCNSVEQIATEVARRRRAWDDLWEHEQTWFPPSLRTLYEAILQHMPALWENYTYPRLAN